MYLHQDVHGDILVDNMGDTSSRDEAAVVMHHNLEKGEATTNALAKGTGGAQRKVFCWKKNCGGPSTLQEL